MLKFFLKCALRIWLIQVILSFLVLFLGILSNSFSDGNYYPFQYGKYISILITFLVLAITYPVYKLFSNKKFKKLKSSFIYFSVTYCISFIFNLALSITDSWYFSNGYLNSFSFIYYSFQWITTILQLFLWVVFIVLFWIAPKYVNENQIKELRNKKSLEASVKIRDLKKLLDEGIISKEVFDEKSKKYIEEL
jgi:hypothetical protein